MAEDGIVDFHQAKRKAARQLGLPEHTAYPDNAEVEAELRVYRGLYQEEGHPELILALRQTALGLLELPKPIASGMIRKFLLNRGVVFEHAEPRNERAEAVLVMETDTADANLVIYPPQLERVVMKHRDGRPRERIRAEGLRALILE
mgnify:CR=1 FL=1